MAPISIAQARVEFVQYSCGRVSILVDGKPLRGVIGTELVADGPNRPVLKLTLHGLAFRVKFDPRSRAEAHAKKSIRGGAL